MRYLILLMLLLNGCTYTQITDVDTGKVYYAQWVKRSPYTGAIGFTDLETGQWIILTEHSTMYIRDLPTHLE